MRFLIVVLLLAFLLCSCAGHKEIIEGTAKITSSEPQTASSFSLEKAIFLGDSNTAHLSSYGLIPDLNIWTGSERYLTLDPDVCRKFIVYPDTGEEMTIADAVKLEKPEYLIITLGTDGAMSLDRNGFRLSYISLIESIQEVSPSTNIVLQSIFPVRPAETGSRFKDPAAANECFTESNTHLEEIAEEYGLIYIDTQSILTDSDGMLRAEYNTDHLDGYHLNRQGLQAMLEFIKLKME